MAAHKIAHVTLKGPSVVKEICLGIVVGVAAASAWKMYQLSEQRKEKAFYRMLERDEISIVAEE